MTSRRPMTRSFSGNGRTSSFSEEEGSSSNGRSESGRNPYLSDVRPENSYSRYSHYRPTRSTLCSVMAQLTEDIQPSFETTVKSKAVSENCNVKFSCVVSGYPAPELKWYKDDLELDRYCGLPKYEIHRNGKTHTLHIYNCTLDDAAIYQVSASNSKGIVSCSGVLEVGTMNEYKIHQRFFAKLKQKAEKKKKDTEALTKKEDKENLQKEKPRGSPEPPPRKRALPPPEKIPPVKEPAAVEQLEAAAAQPNGVGPELKELAPVTSMEKEMSQSDAISAKKKIKISNGVDAGVNSSSNRSHMMGNGGVNCYDGGIGLSYFLAEALQSQAADEKQNSPQVEKLREVDKPVVNVSTEQERKQNERVEQEKRVQEEYEREKKRELELDRDKERLSEHGSEVKHHGKAHKDHIQTSISSMLHTVKDFFFGKGKKDAHDHGDNQWRELQPPQTPPSFHLQPQRRPALDKPLPEEIVPMETDAPKGPSETGGSPGLLIQHKHDNSVLHTDQPLALNPPPESIEEAHDPVEAMEVSAGSEGTSHDEMTLSGLQVVTEGEKRDSPLPFHQDPDGLAAAGDESSPREDISVLPQTQALFEKECPPTSTLTSLKDSVTPPYSVILATDGNVLADTSVESVREEEMSVHEMGKQAEPDMEGARSSIELCEEEKTEVKSNHQPGPDIDSSEITELTPPALEERIEMRESETAELLLSPLSAMEVHTLERGNFEEVAKSAPLIQETNVGFPPTVAPDSLEEADLKILQECTPSVAEEGTEGNNHRAAHSSNPDFRSHEETSDLKEILCSDLEQDLEVISCDTLKLQEQAMAERKITEPKNESLQCELEPEEKAQGKVQETDDSNILLVTQKKEDTANVLEEISNVAHKEDESKSPFSRMKEENANGMEEPVNVVHKEDVSLILSITQEKEGNASVLEEPSNVEHQDGKKELVWSSDKVPQIQLHSCLGDIEPAVPDSRPNQDFVIPEIEIIEPELKESTLVQTGLTFNKTESEPDIFVQKHDATIQEQSLSDLLPTQKGMQSDHTPSPTEKAKEVVQFHDEAEMPEQERRHVISREQLPQTDYGTIPVINILCTDDREDGACVDTHVPDTPKPPEAPVVPLFVVPPIAVTCHESDVRLLSQCESTETETSAVSNRGSKNVTTKPEKNQNQEEMAEKSVTETTPSKPYEAPTPVIGGSLPLLSKAAEENILEILKIRPLKESKAENSVSVEDLLRNKSPVERLTFKPPTHPSLSPASLRKFMSKVPPDSDSESVTAVPVITVGDRQSDKADEDLSGGSTPTTSLSCESSPRLKRRDSLSLIRSATPEELASGARRKIFIPKTKEDGEGIVGVLDAQSKKETPYMSPGQARRAALLLQAPMGQNTPPMERRSPLLSRRKATLEVPKVLEETPTEEPVSTKQEEKPAEKKLDPLKAPQVIRKIRGEPFPDASGHLKLWCQFFNVLSDSSIKWYRDEEEILEVKRSGGDESQVALAIVLATAQDCGVYGCSIKNEYGTDTTDFLLSVDILSDILLKDDLEVGEEIEMTPLLFTKGISDGGNWGSKYFGRVMTETVHVGEGCARKASRVKVIYGLDPVFESGSTCIIKVKNPIAYGTKEERHLTERNLEITRQECKIQNLIREYCKIFAAEARVVENFGHSLEVIPQYLMYRPANSVPYATVETDLNGDFHKYCVMDSKGKLVAQAVSELEQKCCTFQHWIHQWTHGNLLVTRMEGVEMKITNVRVVTKSKGYQGLTDRGSPEVFEQFLMQHQCNYFCGLLGLRPVKPMDSQPAKIKGSRSPLLNRKLSPQLQRKGHSPQMSRKANPSPKVARKVQEAEDNKSGAKLRPTETLSVLERS